MQAFGISEEDVENVMRTNWTRVSNTGGKSFELMASDLFAGLDEGAIEKAALDGGTEMDDQTAADYAEIERQLVADGVLDPLVPSTPVAPVRKMLP